MDPFWTKLERKIRSRLSRYPISYGFIGGIGVVLFWRGVWHSTDALAMYFFDWQSTSPTINLANLADGLLSFAIGSILLLLTGLFVSMLLGNEVIITGLHGEKREVHKTEEEIELEAGSLGYIKRELGEISKKLDALEENRKNQ